MPAAFQDGVAIVKKDRREAVKLVDCGFQAHPTDPTGSEGGFAATIKEAVKPGASMALELAREGAAKRPRK